MLCPLWQGLEGNEDWMGDEEEPLVGFSWRGGFERDTTGILLWSQPFIATLPSGDEVSLQDSVVAGVSSESTEC